MIRRFCDRCGNEIISSEYKADFYVIENKYSFMRPLDCMELCDDCKANRDIMLKAFLNNKTIEFEE